MSTIETVVALGIFLTVLTAVVATSVQLTATVSRQRLRQDVTDSTRNALRQIAAGDFNQLLREAFVVPDPCQVGERRSCLRVAGRVVEVTYSTVLATPPAGARDSARSVDLTATANVRGLDAGTDAVTVTERVNSPPVAPGVDTAIVRVRDLNEPARSAAARDQVAPTTPAKESPPIGLVKPDVTRASGWAWASPPTPFRRGFAVVEALATDCAAGCRLALSDTARYWEGGGFTLAPGDVLGSRAVWRPAAGTLAETSVRVGTPASVTIRLVAQGPDGTLAAPPASAAGSVCLWATFDGGSGRQKAPLCNYGDASVITVASYTDLSTPSQTSYAFPKGATVTVDLDPPDGACAPLAQYPTATPMLGDASGFVPKPVCTSWNWGVPNVVRATTTDANGAATTAPAALPLTVTVDGTSSYELRWSVTARTDAADSRNWAQISAGTDATCAVTTGASLWCWGTGPATGLGAAGVATAPTRIGDGLDWASVQVGRAHACALTRKGELWCWGSNAKGATGLGTTTGTQDLPAQVGSDRWAKVATGADHTCGVKRDGTLWCWGSDGYGQLGQGDKAVPLVTSTLTSTAPDTTLNGTPVAMTVDPAGQLWVAYATKLVKVATDSATPVSYAFGGGTIKGLTAANGYIYFSYTTSTPQGAIGRLDPSAASPTPALLSTLAQPARPGPMTVGADGKLWVADTSAATVWKIGLDGSLIGSTTVGAVPGGIAAGADGSLWATLPATSKIAKITTAGTVQETNLGAASSAVVAGGDGNLWAAGSGGLVFEVTPAGVVASKSASAAVSALAAGPDGNVWGLRAGASNNVIEISSTSATPVSVTAAGTVAGASTIAVSPSGTIWVGALDSLNRAQAIATTPVQVGTAKSWGDVAATAQGTCAVAGSTLALSCVGRNDRAQAGVAPPMMAGPYAVAPALSSMTTTSFTGVKALSGGAATTCATISSGVSCFGANDQGQAAAPGTAVILGATTSPSAGTTSSDVVVDASNNAWLALSSAGGNKLVRVTPQGLVSEYPASAAYADLAYNAGDGGSIWAVTGAKDNMFYRFDPATATTSSFNLGATPKETLSSVEVDGKGGVWATAAAKLYKLNRTNPSTLSPHGTSLNFSSLQGLTRDAAGSLWFVDKGGNRVGKVATPDGTPTVSAVALAASSAPEAIAQGPDGNMWVTLSGTSKVAKVPANMTDTIVYSATLTGSPGLGSIAKMGDGSLWFVETNADKLGRVTTDMITNSALDESVPDLQGLTAPMALAAGTDGTVWMAANGRLARMAMGSAAVSTRFLAGYRDASVGSTHGCALNGTPASSVTLACWGANGSGQLGQAASGTVQTSAVPVQYSDWASVTVSPTQPLTCGTRSSNSGWCWGSNEGSRAGVPLAGPFSSPQQLSTDAGKANPQTPAAGNFLVDPWTKPRKASSATPNGCTTTSTCTSVATGALPEDVAGCTTAPFCLSERNAAAKLFAPAWPYALRPTGPMDTSAPSQVSVTFVDPEGDAVPYTVDTRTSAVAAATSGKLCRDAALTDCITNTSSAATAASGSPVTWWYLPSSNVASFDQFTVTVGGRTHPITLYSTNAPLDLAASASTTVAQGGQVTVPVTVTMADGTPASGTTLTPTVLDASGNAIAAGVTRPTVSGPSATSASGTTSMTVVAGSAPAGRYLVRLQSGIGGTLRTKDVAVDVTQTPAAIQLSGLTATVRDRANATIAGTTVQFELLKGASSASVLPVRARPCVTGASGSCSATLDAPANTQLQSCSTGASQPPSYTVEARAGTITETGDATAAVAAATNTAGALQLRVAGQATPLLSVTQGASVNVTVTSCDSAGKPLASTVTTRVTDANGTTNASGLSTPAASVLTTLPSGAATVTIQASATAPVSSPPWPKLTVTNGTITASLALRVLAAPASVAATDVTVAQGANAAVPVTVRDRSGNPVGGVKVNASVSQDGLRYGGSATTGPDGIARLSVAAAADTPTGAYPMTFRVDGVALAATPTVAVVASKGRVIAPARFSLLQGGQTSWAVRLVDASGLAVAGAEVSAACAPSTTTTTSSSATGCRLIFGAPTKTGPGGRATFTLSDPAPGSTPGRYDVVVTAAGKTYLTTVRVRSKAAFVQLVDSGAVRLPVNATATVVVKLTDASGAPVPGTVVELSADRLNPTAAVTGPDGTALLVLTALVNAATGDTTATITAGTVTTATTVTLEAAVAL